jgi:hypothetical protein
MTRIKGCASENDASSMSRNGLREQGACARRNGSISVETGKMFAPHKAQGFGGRKGRARPSAQPRVAQLASIG